MSAHIICNKVQKLNPPPFVTTIITSAEARRVIFKTWSILRKKSNVNEQTRILEVEIELLKGYIERKGTQLRLEKALLLTNRIYKLGTRWLGNRFLHEYLLFDDGVQLSLEGTSNNTKTKAKKKKKQKTDEGEMEEVVAVEKDCDVGSCIRLPSRQWANWIIYLTLRDSLILAKIKYECERTVEYWLGLISSSHHASDSLVAVGILSRMWYVSSCMVEGFINVMYPTVCKLSIHLEPTKAENWLKDLETPLENLSDWLEIVLGSPFTPARLSRGIEDFGKSSIKKAKMETVLDEVFKGKLIEKINPGNKEPRPSTSSAAATTKNLSDDDDDEEDLGVPVVLSTTKKAQPSKKKATKKSQTFKLNEKWTTFFKGYKLKLKSEKGKKQLIVRIKKYLEEETDREISLRLKKLRKCIKTGKHEEMLKMVTVFQKFLSKK